MSKKSVVKAVKQKTESQLQGVITKLIYFHYIYYFLLNCRVQVNDLVQ